MPQKEPRKEKNKAKATRHTSTDQGAKTYKSIYKSGYVTEAAYIVELVFQKRSEFFNSGRTPESFWNSKELQGAFKGQIIQAHRLLKKYSGLAIIDALKQPESKFIFKLQDKKLIPVIEKCQKNIKEKELIKEEALVKQQKPFGTKKNILGDL